MQNAPKEAGAILNDLRLLSSVIAKISHQEQRHGKLDSFIAEALAMTSAKVTDLRKTIEQLQLQVDPDLPPQSGPRRVWSGFKATRKKALIRDFKQTLEEAKSTLLISLLPSRMYLSVKTVVLCMQRKLILASPSYPATPSEHAHLERALICHRGSLSQQSPSLGHQTSLNTVLSGIDDLKNHFETLQERILVVADSISNPVLRSGYRMAAQEAAQTLAADATARAAVEEFLPRPTRLNSPVLSYAPASSTPDTSDPKANPARRCLLWRQPDSATQRVRCRKAYIAQIRTVFGIVIIQSAVFKETGYSKAQVIDSSVQIETSFSLHPSDWLVSCGLKYGLRATFVQSAVGWKYNLSPIRAVSNESLIFSFCSDGNVAAIQTLFSRGEASPYDTDSNGWTPLHVSISEPP